MSIVSIEQDDDEGLVHISCGKKGKLTIGGAFWLFFFLNYENSNCFVHDGKTSFWCLFMISQKKWGGWGSEGGQSEYEIMHHSDDWEDLRYEKTVTRL